MALPRYRYYTAWPGEDIGLPAVRNPRYTVCLWIKGSVTGQGDRRYFCESSTANNNPLFAFGAQQYGTNASTRTYIRNLAGTVVLERQNINTTTNLDPTLDGAWHHIALVNDGTFSFYVDGVLDYTASFTLDGSTFDTTSIGAIVRAAVGSYLNVAVDDLAVWARALSLEEIQNVMTNSIVTPVPSFAPDFSTVPAGGSNFVVGDSWTLSAGAYGTRPMTYQWTKNGTDISGATTSSLAFAPLAAGDEGDYALVAANAVGKATSAVARIQFAAYGTPNLTNQLVAYWPLDAIVGSKTVDLVSGYDMTLSKMGQANLVAGRWGSAFLFDNTAQTMLQRINKPGEDLPIYSKSNFTVSLWVNGGVQSDHRVFSEGSTVNTSPLFNIGTHNGGTDGTVDSYIRTDSGAYLINHAHSTGTAFDGTWHHIAYVHRDLGGGNMVANFYIDGSKDPVLLGPIRPLTLDTTTIGGILRGSPSAWFTGMIDEVAVWDRALSPQEITALQVTYITNPPSRLQPLAINSFTADLPAVARGGTNLLRWDVSKDATQVTIDQGIGDVTSRTVVGVGTNLITVTNTTSYILTVKRGVDTLTATTTVAVVEGIAPGWTLLDNFDRYSAGQLFGTGYWTDPHGNSALVEDYQGNMVLKTVTSDSIVFLNLQTLTIPEYTACTLFFRLIPGSDTAAAITNIVGLTDKSQRSYADEFFNIGPVLYPTPLTNDVAGIPTNAWYLGARNMWFGNNTSGPVDYPATPPVTPFEPGAVYNVWIDITNEPVALMAYDHFTVYVQKEGAAQRNVLFQDYMSDRDPDFVDVILGGMKPNLDKLVVMGNNASYSALFDDFYLSKDAYNATVPRPYGFTGPVGPLPALQVGRSGNQLEIRWTTGVLQQADSVTGGWADVQGAAPPSYLVTPGPGAKFYRARP